MKLSSFQAVILLVLGFAGGIGAMSLATDRFELHVRQLTEGSSEQIWRLDKWTGRTWRLEKDVWLPAMGDALHPDFRRGSER
jgi:hypothetical protein